MSRTITITCDRCGATTDGQVAKQGYIRSSTRAWRFVSRDTDLCPECSDAFESWRGRFES